MIDYAIEKLLAYALDNELIQPCEKLWALNTLLEVLELDSYTPSGKEVGEVDLPAVLDELMDDAYARGVMKENSIVYRDLLTPRSWALSPPAPPR